MRMTRRGRIGTGTGVVLAGAVAVGLLVVPSGATAAPALPPVSPEDLVSSVIAAKPAPFAGTVIVDNELGLPALPGLPQAANGSSTVRVWSGGGGLGRVALPSSDGEKTLVSDGTTRWSYDSQDRTATKAPGGAGPGAGAGSDTQGSGTQDPIAAATQAVAELRKDSTVAVDGTAEVAGRAAYTLVLSPAPTERTLLRQVRVAVDAQSRIPLQLTVLANGSAQPALQVGFSDISFGPQDPSLFTFTPPAGTTVTDAPARGADGRPQGADGVTTVGEGWDTVVTGKVPSGPNAQSSQQDGQAQRPEGAPDPAALAALGTPVSGPWGSGHEITTAVATAIVTDDGRFAAGAVPEQVLTEALGK